MFFSYFGYYRRIFCGVVILITTGVVVDMFGHNYTNRSRKIDF